jgi:hypothetical protein
MGGLMSEENNGLAWGAPILEPADKTLPVVRRLHRELSTFRSIHAPAEEELTNFWFSRRTLDLAVAAAAHEGVKLCLNVNGFTQIDPLLKRLALIADLILCRDIRAWGQPGLAFVPVPPDFSGFECLPETDPSRFPPMLLRDPAGPGYITSSQVSCSGDRQAALMGVEMCKLPEGTYQWLNGGGRPWLDSGSVMYAPFYPDLEVETEFIRQGAYFPTVLDAIPIDPANATGWQSDKVTAGVLRLQVPWLDNVSPELIAKIKADEGHAFALFRNRILSALEESCAAAGSSDFGREVKRIQRDIVDEGVARITEVADRVSRMQTMRAAGVLALTVVTGISCMVGLPVTAGLAATGASVVAFVTHLREKLQEEGKLREDSAYFLWRLRRGSPK